MAPVKSERISIGIRRFKPYDSYPRLKSSVLSPSLSSLLGRDKEQVEKLPLPSQYLEHLTDFSNGADSDSDLDDCNATPALKYYNSLHHTDYKVVSDNGFKCDDHIFPSICENQVIIHRKFAAKSKRAVDGDCSATLFFAELHRRNLEKEVVISCRILDGLTTGCSDCDELYHFILDQRLKSSGPYDSYNHLKSLILSPLQGRDEELLPPSPNLEHPIDFSDGADSDSDNESDGDDDLDDCDDYNAKAALKYYNSLNRTDYKVVRDNGFKCDEHIYYPNIHRDLAIIHCKFSAKSKGAVDGDSPAKLFFAELYWRKIEKEVVISCRILDGPTTGCSGCDILYHYILACRLQSSGQKEKAKAEERRNDGTFPNIALAYYHETHHEEYEFVGDSEAYLFVDLELVIHCNFRAKRKTGCGGYEASLPKLFFAEMEKTSNVWEVRSCDIIDGCRTIAGCYMCQGRRGKKIQHPSCEFRHGFYNELTGRTFIDDASKL